MRRAGNPCPGSGSAWSSPLDRLDVHGRSTPAPGADRQVWAGADDRYADQAGEGHSGRRSELVERGLLFRIDLEDLIKPGDPENLQQIGMNAAKLELALDRGDFLLEVDQLAERGAGEILHVTEVQQDVLVTLILDQAVELLAHFLDLFFGHDLGINETDNRHSINVFQAEETARALRHRETPVGDGNRTGPRQLMFVQAGP